MRMCSVLGGGLEMDLIKGRFQRLLMMCNNTIIEVDPDYCALCYVSWSVWLSCEALETC